MHFSSSSGGGQPAPPPTSVAPPRDLVTSDITARSFRVTWTHAPGQVEKYRVVYYPASGGQPDEKVLGSLLLLIIKFVYESDFIIIIFIAVCSVALTPAVILIHLALGHE